MADNRFTQSPQAFLGTDDVSRFPAGMRNNNPGNLKYNPNVPWKGLVGPSVNKDQGDSQAVFESPQAGINAMSKLILNKFNKGQDTVDGIIRGTNGKNGWTAGPAVDGAVANVAKAMGVGPGDRLNLRDPQQMASFQRALITQEHGPQGKAYHPLVDGAVNYALNGAAPSAPVAQAAPAPTQTITSGTGIQARQGGGLLGFQGAGINPRAYFDTPATGSTAPSGFGGITPGGLLSDARPLASRAEPNVPVPNDIRMPDGSTMSFTPSSGPYSSGTSEPTPDASASMPMPGFAPASASTDPMAGMTGPTFAGNGFGTTDQGFVGTDTTGAVQPTDGGLLGTSTAPAAAPADPDTTGPAGTMVAATDPASAGGATPATPAASDPAQPGGDPAQTGAGDPKKKGMDKEEMAQRAIKGIMGLGALGARGPLHYAPPVSANPTLHAPAVEVPEVYKAQANRILPKIGFRGLLG